MSLRSRAIGQNALGECAACFPLFFSFSFFLFPFFFFSQRTEIDIKARDNGGASNVPRVINVRISGRFKITLLPLDWLN